eukprot:NODE_114_length_19305_cov_0.149849.p13 type:complete len:105 gc:universal NODE_114_length_19305_cov_0.149849:18719-18405(-)
MLPNPLIFKTIVFLLFFNFCSKLPTGGSKSGGGGGKSSYDLKLPLLSSTGLLVLSTIIDLALAFDLFGMNTFVFPFGSSTTLASTISPFCIFIFRMDTFPSCLS